MDAATKQAQNKKVVLEKLGKFKIVLDVIRSVGEVLSDVSVSEMSLHATCSFSGVRYIRR